MTITTLKEVLASEGILSNWYSIENHGIKEAKICIEAEGSQWSVYYSERGVKYDVAFFSEESSACEEMLRRLREKKNKFH